MLRASNLQGGFSDEGRLEVVKFDLTLGHRQVRREVAFSPAAGVVVGNLLVGEGHRMVVMAAEDHVAAALAG